MSATKAQPLTLKCPGCGGSDDLSQREEVPALNQLAEVELVGDGEVRLVFAGYRHVGQDGRIADPELACGCGWEGDRDELEAECPECDGEGEVTHNPGWPDPQTEVDERCGRCGGDGLIHPEPTR
jgi:hypothetical protein